MSKLLLTDLKVLFRIPVNVFFSIFFPLFMCTVFIISYGNFSLGGGYTFVDKELLIGLSLSLPPITLVSFSATLSELLNNGVAERYFLFHVSVFRAVLSQLMIHCLMGVIQFAILVIYLKLGFGLHVQSLTNIVSLFLAYLFVLIAFLTIGGVIGILCKRSESALTISMFFMFVFYFFSGCFVEFDQLPETVKQISSVIPLRYLAQEGFLLFSGAQFVNGKLIMSAVITIAIFSVFSFYLIQKKYGVYKNPFHKH